MGNWQGAELFRSVTGLLLDLPPTPPRTLAFLAGRSRVPREGLVPSLPRGGQGCGERMLGVSGWTV